MSRALLLTKEPQSELIARSVSELTVVVPDMLAVGCDLNGRHYENGHAFQPSPLYKCTCIAGAIGCTPAFTQTPAGLLGSAPLKPAGLLSGPGARKNLQDTSYKPGEGRRHQVRGGDTR